MAPPIFQDTRWLGGKHNGYQRVPLEEYLELRSSSKDVDSSRERAAKLQCLMTFGLLEAVTEEEIREETLVRLNSSGEQVVTSEHLPDLLLRFRERFLNLQGIDKAEESRRWAKRVEDALVYASYTIHSECAKENKNAFWSSDLERLVLAEIVIQMGSICDAVKASIQGLFRPEKGTAILWSDLVPSEYLSLTISSGCWCPAIVEDIVSDGSACILGYARTLKCPQSRVSEGHKECKTKKCLVSTKNTSEDAAKHVSESCRCKNAMPSLEDVTRLLENRKIPVVDVGLSVKDSFYAPYVAISHVWADGLRGTTESGLPACQVERLAGLAGRILRTGWEGAFWIDTLCIPELADMKHRAIGLMGQTYKEAEAVLVIDAGIRDISVYASDEERLFNVVYSRWMQRLWTFQEAALAKELYFQFSDDALVPIQKLLIPFVHSHIRDMNAVGFYLLESLLRRGSLRFFSGTKVTLEEVTFVLRKRKVSKPSDELLAVCSALDLDGYKLARESDVEQRMCDFLLQIGKFPAEIIFHYLPRKWRVSKYGFRWAPRTFMPQEGVLHAATIPPTSPDKSDAVCTPTGLEAEYDAITEGVDIIGNKRAWYIYPKGGETVYQVSPRVPNSDITDHYPFPINYEFFRTIMGIKSVHDVSPRVQNSDVYRESFSRLASDSIITTFLGINTILVDTSDGWGFRDIVSRRIQCVGVWVNPESADGGRDGDRILCDFRAPLTLHRVTQTELSEMKEPCEVMTVGSELRRIKVKLV